MKVSLLLPDLRGGGTERVMLDLAHEFARAGHEPEFVLMRVDGDFLAEARSAFCVVDLGTPRMRQLPLALTRYLRRTSADALLTGMWPLTAIAPFAARMARFRGRVVVSEHCMLSIQYGAWGRLHRIALRTSMALGYRFAHERIGVSEGVVRDIARLAGMPESKFRVIHNPVPPRAAPGRPALLEADALWEGPRGARVLTVGSLKPVKNYALLLRAFVQVARRPGARLMFVGAGPGESALRAMADEMGLTDRVIFAGFRADPTPFYYSADLFVLSSDYEGFGNVIVEALACGTPVVSTDCPSGPREILDRGRYGTLVPVGDTASLSTAIDDALSRQHDSGVLRNRARNFDPKIAAQNYLGALGLK